SDALRMIEAMSGVVVHVERDTVSRPALAQSGPLVGAPTAWSAGFDGRGTVVVILDSGVDRTHPFLANKVVAEVCFSSTTTGPLPSTSLCPNGKEEQFGVGAATPCTLSECRHGTHVAGIAAGNGGPAGVSFSGIARGAQITAIQIHSRFSTPD